MKIQISLPDPLKCYFSPISERLFFFAQINETAKHFFFFPDPPPSFPVATFLRVCLYWTLPMFGQMCGMESLNLDTGSQNKYNPTYRAQ